MRLKVLITKIFLASFLFLILVQTSYAVPCVPGATPTPCPSGQFCPACEPQSLPQLEILAVQMIGLIWVMTGMVFFGIFVYNGYLYMFNQIEDAKKRMVQWLIGILLIFISQPVITTVMRVIIPEGTVCYEQLRQPSFTFFFPDVCTNITPSP